MGPSRMLSLSRKSMGVETLDIKSRVRELCELAASEKRVTEEMAGIVRFLVQAELVLLMSASEEAPYRASFVVDLERLIETEETIVEKLMRVSPRDVRLCMTSPNSLFLTFMSSGSAIVLAYSLPPETPKSRGSDRLVPGSTRTELGKSHQSQDLSVRETRPPGVHEASSRSARVA